MERASKNLKRSRVSMARAEVRIRDKQKEIARIVESITKVSK